MWIQRLRSSPPASSRTTRVVGSSERRVAITQPAEPAPTTTKSASRSSCWLAMRFPLLELFDPNGGIAPILADIASGAQQSPSHYALEWRLPRRCAPREKLTDIDVSGRTGLLLGRAPRTASAGECSLAADIRRPRAGAETGPCIPV